ncbi:MAG: hypothetical protein FWC69_05035 [Defluviitaleaceae bacterium]|nr:hypothetical protein [Defluviitaleaceae bacterium]
MEHIFENDDIKAVIGNIAYCIKTAIEERKLDEFIRKNKLTTQSFKSHFNINFINTKVYEELRFGTKDIEDLELNPHVASNGYITYRIIDKTNKVIISYKGKSVADDSLFVEEHEGLNEGLQQSLFSVSNKSEKLRKLGLSEEYEDFHFILIIYNNNLNFGSAIYRLSDGKISIPSKEIDVPEKITLVDEYIERAEVNIEKYIEYEGVYIEEMPPFDEKDPF